MSYSIQMCERQRKVSAFIRNTYRMLENEDHFQIVSWSQFGTGFVIKNVQMFSQLVLPQYFKHKNYESFVRQLNMYGFHKQRQQNDLHEFVHQSFRRGALEEENSGILIAGLKRKPEKKKKSGASLKKLELGSQSRALNSQRVEQKSNQERSVSIVLKSEENLEAESVSCSNSRVQSGSDMNVSNGEEQYKGKDSYTEKNKGNKMSFEDHLQEEQWVGGDRKPRGEWIIAQNEQLTKIHSFIRQSLLQLKVLNVKDGILSSRQENRPRVEKVIALIQTIEAQKNNAKNLLEQLQPKILSEGGSL